jgi:hypothetical protein
MPWLRLGAVAAAAAACFGAGWATNGWRLGSTIAKLEAKAFQMAAENRATESRWANHVITLGDEANVEAERLRADLARAADAARSLHDASQRRATEAAESAGAGSPAGAAVLVLADLFGRADGRAGELAAALDAAHAAGTICERFDALTR